MKAWRVVLALAGVGLLGFGVFRLLSQVPGSSLVMLALWMVVAIAVHDGILSPLVVGVGWGLRRVVPDRARRFVQVGLISSALVTVIAVPMIALRGSQPAVKALLLRPYGTNLALLVGLIGAVTLTLYAVRVARDRRGPADT